jgi:acyl-coenzyme A thioesterase PaaI-like protein
MGNKIGVYEVSITKNDGTLVALFKGTVYRTNEQWAV